MHKQSCLVLIILVSTLYALPTGPTKKSRYSGASVSKSRSTVALMSKSRTTEAPEGKFMLFEGDIRVPIGFNPTKRNAVANKGYLWPNGAIPYTISNRFNDTLVRLFENSMRQIEEATKVNGRQCVKFVPRSRETGYIHLEMFKKCSSSVGRLSEGRQIVSLGRQCYNIGTVMHELIHALGFYHEQSRADRDTYIDVHMDNVKKGAEKNFLKFALGTSVDHLDQPYDYDSIMHYHGSSFAKDPSKPTITPKITLTNGVKLGQRDHLSKIDIKMIQKLYSCDEDVVTDVYPNGPCRDTLDNCHLYGQYACSELPKWAAESCAVTCGICVPDCSDRSTECQKYTKDQICDGTWAKDNCAKYCNLGDCQYIKAVTEPVEHCVDDLSDCADYGPSVCKTHRAWASDKCARFCQFCTTGQGIATTTPTPSCVDLMDCSSFTMYTCTMAESYMRTNCPKHCNLCPAGQQAKTTTTTTTPKPTTEDPNCFNKIDDCADYGQNACNGYRDWAKLNCMKYCGFCYETTTTPTTTPTTTTPTTTTTTPTTTTTTTTTTTPPPTTMKAGPIVTAVTDDCYDQADDCQDYTHAVCKSHAGWAQTNCRMFCGFCTAAAEPESEAPVCSDKIDDCKDYTDTICTNHRAWANENCQVFCGICTPPSTTPTTTARNPNCYDVLGDCKDYGTEICTDYAAWSNTNCQMFCGFCDATKEKCEDKRTDCYDFDKTQCGGDYTAYMKKECASYCGYC